MATVTYDFQFTIHSGAVRATQGAAGAPVMQISTGRIRSDQGQNFGESMLGVSNSESSTQTINVVASTQLAKVQQIAGTGQTQYSFVQSTEDEEKDKVTIQKSDDQDVRTQSTPELFKRPSETQQQPYDQNDLRKKTDDEVRQDGSSTDLTDPLQPIDIETLPPQEVVEGQNPPPTEIEGQQEEELPEPENPPLPNEAFFTSGDDIIDFSVDTNDLDGDGDTQGPINLFIIETDPQSADPQAIFYNALGGNDIVYLPTSDSIEINGYDLDRTFNAGEGNDTVVAGDLGNIIDGGPGNDIIIAGPEPDQLFGGEGFDIVSYQNSFSFEQNGVNIDLATDFVGVFVPAPNLGTSDAEGDSISGFEGVIGTSGFDSMTGSDGANYFDGLDSPDIVNAGGGNDLIVYENADHTSGFTSVNGEGGTDTLLFDGTDGAINLASLDISGIEVFDLDWDSVPELLTDGLNLDVTLNLDNLNGADFAFSADDFSLITAITIEGDSGDNVIFGTSGNWLTQAQVEAIDSDFEIEDYISDAAQEAEILNKIGDGYTPIFDLEFSGFDTDVVLLVNPNINLTLPS